MNKWRWSEIWMSVAAPFSTLSIHVSYHWNSRVGIQSLDILELFMWNSETLVGSQRENWCLEKLYSVQWTFPVTLYTFHFPVIKIVTFLFISWRIMSLSQVTKEDISDMVRDDWLSKIVFSLGVSFSTALTAVFGEWVFPSLPVSSKIGNSCLSFSCDNFSLTASDMRKYGY